MAQVLFLEEHNLKKKITHHRYLQLEHLLLLQLREEASQRLLVEGVCLRRLLVEACLLNLHLQEVAVCLNNLLLVVICSRSLLVHQLAEGCFRSSPLAEAVCSDFQLLAVAPEAVLAALALL